MVEVEDVRLALNNISADLISDDTIFQKIEDAKVEIEHIKPTKAPQQIVEKAILYKAALLAYQAYLISIERGTGVPPTPSGQVLLKSLEDQARKYVTLMYEFAGDKMEPKPTVSMVPSVVDEEFES